MTERLAGKVVVVTGAETGIGRAIALTCARDGARVMGAGIQIDALGELAAEAAVAGYDDRLATMVCDVREPDQIGAVFEACVSDFGRLDAAVANAGVFVQQTPLIDWTQAEWDNVVAINATGVFLTLQAAARILVAQGDGGSLLATGSSTAVRPRGGALPYVASKGAVHQMMRALTIELAEHKIRVNTIVPGLTLSPGTEGRPGHIERSVKLIPMGEVVMPQEIAEFVGFALSDEAPHMTGIELKIDAARTSG